ncbi:MAG: hypothetical protein V7K40_04825 [Nostoc sp.]|uniref:hypothetical protein n=1 Tax=Nostoc sp. TaxID=1180 RepID=UPI002FFB08B5
MRLFSINLRKIGVAESKYESRDRLRAAVSIKNIFNVDYHESSSDILRVFPGEPLTVQGTISWQF